MSLIILYDSADVIRQVYRNFLGRINSNPTRIVVVDAVSEINTLMDQETVKAVFINYEIDGRRKGVELAKQLRQKQPNSKIVIVSSFDVPSNPYTTFQLGKPFTQAQLTDAIMLCLE